MVTNGNKWQQMANVDLDQFYRSIVKFISTQDLRHLILTAPSEDYTVVDVRDSDYKYFHITNSVNYPSRHFDDERIAELLRRNSKSKCFIFHCMRSQNRGPRCAKRFVSYIVRKVIKDDLSNLQDGFPKVYILKGGFKKWYQEFYNQQELIKEI